MKVIFAYCHELGRSVSIDDARTEFFSRKPEERRRFTFSCSDRNCGITITGVNYHIKAEDGKKFRVAHFASRKPHLPKCEWVQFTEDFEQDKLSNESEHDFTERKARQKLTDYINSFDPSIDDSEVESIVSCQPSLLAIGKNTYEKNKMVIMMVIHDGVATRAQIVYNGLLIHGRKPTKNYLLMNCIL